MTAKEKLLAEAPKWSEHEALLALRAVERGDAGASDLSADRWGDVDEFSARGSAETMRRLDDQEEHGGFSWEVKSRSGL